MDSIAIIGDGFNEINKLKASLSADFQIEDPGSLKYFLGDSLDDQRKELLSHKESMF